MNRKRLLTVGACSVALVLAFVAGLFVPRSAAPAVVSRDSAPGAVREGWTLRSKHLLYGMPALKDSRYGDGAAPGVSVLVREGFVVGHYDRAKAPLWMSMRWTRSDFDASETAASHRRDFKADDELPESARGLPVYKAPGYDRGHLARNKDNTAWGEDNALMGDLMSNIVPQRASLNRGVWLTLEDEHRSIVSRREAKIDSIWIIAGSVYPEGSFDEVVGNGIGVPSAIFKIVAWHDADGRFQAMGFLFPQSERSGKVERYLVPISSIEDLTGLDFFPRLDAARQSLVERAEPAALWRSLP